MSMSYYNKLQNDIARLPVESTTATKQWMQRYAISDRATTKTVVSVINSFSQNKIEVPVRGKHCLHLQPFDAQSFLKRPYEYRRCPVCDEKIRYGHLMKMEYFQQLFDHWWKFYPQVELIEIQTNGTRHKIGLSASNDDYGSNNGNSVLSMNDSNCSNPSISGSTRNRVQPTNFLKGMAVEPKATTMQWTQIQYDKQRKNGGAYDPSVPKMLISVIGRNQQRIEVPVRGRDCSHLQPFDAMTFLSRPAQYQRCPQCNKRIRREDLVKMEYFQEMFDHLKIYYSRVVHIELVPDGRVRFVRVRALGKHDVYVDSKEVHKTFACR